MRASSAPRRVPAVRAWWVTCLLGCLALPPAAADPEPAASAGEALARAYVRRRSLEGDEKAWYALHMSDADPWSLAEDLLALGLESEAVHLTHSFLTTDGSSLLGYVAQGNRVDLKTRRILAQARRTLEEGDPQAALALLPDLIEPSVTQVEAHALRARCHGARSQVHEQRLALDQAAAAAFALGWRRAERDALEAALALLDEATRTASERRLLRRLLEVDDDARGLPRSAAWSARLGMLEARAGLQQSARGLLREADALFTTLAGEHGATSEARALHARALAALARLHQMSGDVAAAMHTAQRSHDRAAGGPPAARTEAARVMADAYLAIARRQEAHDYLLEALASARDQSPEILARIQGDLAWAKVVLGRVDEAEALYAEVEASPLMVPHTRYPYVLRLHRAAARIEAGVPARDSKILRQAVLELTQVLQDLSKEPEGFAARSEIELNARTLLGRGLRHLGRAQDALGTLQFVVEHSAAQIDPALHATALREYGRCQLALGQDTAARLSLDRALADLAAYVAGLPGAHGLGALSRPGVDDLIQGCLAGALRRNSPEAVLDTLEATRGLIFLPEARRRVSGRVGERYLAGRSTGTLARAVADAARAYWEARDSGTIRSIREASQRLFKERKALREHEEAADLAAALDSRQDGAGGAGELAFRARSALANDEAMLYLALVDGTYSMVVSWDGRVRAAELGPADVVERTALGALLSWAEPDAQEPASLAATAEALIPAELRAQLGWVKGASAGPRHVYLSADGRLGALPWAALLDALPALSDREAAQVPTLSFVASQEVLKHIKTWNPPCSADGPVLALGDPDYQVQGSRLVSMAFGGGPLVRLAASRAEVQGIVDPARGDIALLGTRANEELLAHCLTDAPYPFEILHLSCHGLLQPQTPWLSALALHATPNSDGLISVEEVGRWQFRGGPRLVVLAACESGRGVPVAGEGEDGLVRAFHLAGARQVVGSLWKVPDDASRDLMIALHRALRVPGTSVPEALRLAQRRVRTSTLPNASHPHAWAAWAVWGPAR